MGGGGISGAHYLFFTKISSPGGNMGPQHQKPQRDQRKHETAEMGEISGAIAKFDLAAEFSYPTLGNPRLKGSEVPYVVNDSAYEFGRNSRAPPQNTAPAHTGLLRIYQLFHRNG